MPWRRAGSTAPRHSSTAFTLPGRLRIRVSPRMPAVSRLSMPWGVWRRLSARMASGRPGVKRSITEAVASGVMSRLEKPVPPVVAARQTFFSSQQRRRAARMAS